VNRPAFFDPSSLSLDERLLYETLRIRLVELRIIQLYPSDCIQSPVHLSIGQEAVAAGACAALRPDDLVFGTYRSHAFYLAKGGDLRQMMAELYGKATGCCGGKAGSMHLAAPEVGLMGSSAIVASTIPHAVGAALAARRRGSDQIVVAVFGDGATEEGVYHESLNFAALHELPVLFLCENNGLAVHSRIQARQAYDLLDHADTYGIPARRCPRGNDPRAVYDAVAAAVARVRAERRPLLLVVDTYRQMEHVGIGDDHQVGYRSSAEAEPWRRTDPLVTQTDLVARFTPDILREIEDAVAFAEESPWPGADALLADVA
jgi:TPP-dependent pyruvate/acetoin dehydrogenase alpha subunit